MDKTRLTTMAVVSMCPTDNPYIPIPDTLSYNHDFGWYGGSVETYGPRFDKFHAEHPNQPSVELFANGVSLGVKEQLMALNAKLNKIPSK